MSAGDPYRTSNDDVGPIVRSVRIAAALNERFAELSKPTKYPSDESLSNALGEARQLFPEIWANLDHARDQLVKRGQSVPAYDALRASLAARSGGVLEVEVTEATIRHTKGKTASLNLAGHTAAREAEALLRAALPHVDWEALERAEAAELAAIGSLGPARWKKIVFYTVAGILMVIALIGLIVFRIHTRHP